MKLSGRKFFQPLRSAWNPPIGDALKTCALVSPGSRWLASIYIKSLRTCRLHGGDLCAEMFRKSALQQPARPFLQKPPRTSIFDRRDGVSRPVPHLTARPRRVFQPLRRSRPSGSIGLCAGSYCRWPGSGRSESWVIRAKAPPHTRLQVSGGGDGANCEKSTGYFILYETTSLLT